MKKTICSMILGILPGLTIILFINCYNYSKTIKDQEVTINQLEKAIVDYENYQDEDLKYISDLEDHLDLDHIKFKEKLQYIEELEQLLQERGE